MKVHGDILNFCDFSQVFVSTSNHHLNWFCYYVNFYHIAFSSGILGGLYLVILAFVYFHNFDSIDGINTRFELRMLKLNLLFIKLKAVIVCRVIKLQNCNNNHASVHTIANLK